MELRFEQNNLFKNRTVFCLRGSYVQDSEGYFYYITSCIRPRVAVAHSGEMEENGERGSARFTYV
jgi:hypothetical protein